MKKIKNYILYLVLLFVPFVVFAAPATAHNWKLHCEESTIAQGGTTKCYLLAEIGAATEGGTNITAVMTKMSGRALFIDDVAGGSSGITATKTESGVAFTGSLNHGPDVTRCGGALGCYDFTSQAILPNTSTSVSQGENSAYTPIGVWTVRIDEEAITPDSSDCAQICMDVDYILGTFTHGASSDISGTNATCQELHLTSSKKVCKIEGETYYGSNGSVVTKEQYEEQCTTPKKICKIENGTYYDASGNVVTKEDFLQKCACRIDGSKYYDDTGAEVNKEVYLQKCTCRIADGKYYDDTGAEVNKEVFLQKCTCKIENGKYYDSTGTEVTKEVYEKKCTCRQTLDGKYYGKDGNEITKEQYDKDCVPPTGSFASYAVLAAGALIALSAIMIAQKHNRFYKV